VQTPQLDSALQKIIGEGRLVIIGPIRQELLSGIKDRKQFERLKMHLSAFPDEDLVRSDYERAAECFNKCRSKGIQGSHVDFLICSLAIGNGWSILSDDPDFRMYSRYLSIILE
jgi:predicted nucleic acid-binding protein